METILKSIAVPSGEGRSIEVLPGETVTFKAVSTDTDGAYTLIEVIDEPQAGPPLHLHGAKTSRFTFWREPLPFRLAIAL